MPAVAGSSVTQTVSSVRLPAEIKEAARAREAALSRLLMAFVCSGLVFMLVPGSFLGAWNLPHR